MQIVKEKMDDEQSTCFLWGQSKILNACCVLEPKSGDPHKAGYVSTACWMSFIQRVSRT